MKQVTISKTENGYLIEVTNLEQEEDIEEQQKL